MDWNPAGANILCVYRFGSARMGESQHYALRTLGWLGARSSQLQQADAGAFQVGPGLGWAGLDWAVGTGRNPWETSSAAGRAQQRWVPRIRPCACLAARGRLFEAAGCLLGPRHSGSPPCSVQELTARDRSMAANLSAVLRGAAPEWAAELGRMLSSGSKAEIEALETGEGGADLADLLVGYLERGDCI